MIELKNKNDEMTESQKGRYYFNPCHYRMDYLVSKKINPRLFFPTAIPNLARLFFVNQ